MSLLKSYGFEPQCLLPKKAVKSSSVTVSSRHGGRSSVSLLIDCMVTVPTLPGVCFPLDKIKSIPNLTPLLVTIDPDRDTVEAMAAYVKGRVTITMQTIGNSSKYI